jgi:hypothetical protein
VLANATEDLVIANGLKPCLPIEGLAWSRIGADQLEQFRARLRFQIEAFGAGAQKDDRPFELRAVFRDYVGKIGRGDRRLSVLVLGHIRTLHASATTMQASTERGQATSRIEPLSAALMHARLTLTYAAKRSRAIATPLGDRPFYVCKRTVFSIKTACSNGMREAGVVFPIARAFHPPRSLREGFNSNTGERPLNERTADPARERRFKSF